MFFFPINWISWKLHFWGQIRRQFSDTLGSLSCQKHMFNIRPAFISDQFQRACTKKFKQSWGFLAFLLLSFWKKKSPPATLLSNDCNGWWHGWIFSFRSRRRKGYSWVLSGKQTICVVRKWRRDKISWKCERKVSKQRRMSLEGGCSWRQGKE